MTDKTVAVLLITYHSCEDLPAFLDSLGPAVQPLELDEVCVDNASTDNGPELVQRFGGRVARNTTNIGLSAAINQAAAMTDAHRHHLSRAGDRQLNCALHVIAITHTAGRAYYQSKREAGKGNKEALRCPKRQLAGGVYRTMIRDTGTSLLTDA